MAACFNILRILLGWILPYRLVVLIRKQRQMKRLAKMSARARANREEIGLKSREDAVPWNRTDAFDFLYLLGLDPDLLARTSIPEHSLNFACKALERHLGTQPVYGLHIGNFVGVSLCHFTNFVRQLNVHSTIVSIDPNVPHVGIHRPMDFVLRCLNRYGLQRNSIVLAGYSLEKNASNEGMPVAGYDPAAEFSKEQSCENQLPQLIRMLPPIFDFAVIDGNHEKEYLAQEIEALDRLLKPGGVLVLDDVDWDELGKVYSGIDRDRYLDLGNDGRVGLLKKIKLDRAEVAIGAPVREPRLFLARSSEIRLNEAHVR